MNVNSDSGNVNTDSGKSLKSVHLQPESLFTLNQNGCSRSSGMGVHDGPEYAISRLVPKFGLADMTAFIDLKRTVPPGAVQSIVSQTTGFDDTDGNPISADRLSTYFADKIPEGYTGWDDPDLLNNSVAEEGYIRNLLVTHPNGAEVAIILEEMINNAEALRPEGYFIGDTWRDYLANNLLHDKIQVCVLPEGMKGAAEGHTIGFNIASNEEFSFYMHEGTHFVQKQYAEQFPRWFTEGQAVYFAGPAVFNPVVQMTAFKRPIYYAQLPAICQG